MEHIDFCMKYVNALIIETEFEVEKLSDCDQPFYYRICMIYKCRFKKFCVYLFFFPKIVERNVLL